MSDLKKKYSLGTLVKSEVTDVIYLITSVSTKNEPEFGRYTVLPLMNVAARALGLHEDSFYTVTGIDLEKNYYIIGKFDLDILKNSISNSCADDKEYPTPFETAFMVAYMSAYGSLKESFDKDHIDDVESSIGERLDKIESAIERIECKLCMRTAKRFMYDDGK